MVKEFLLSGLLSPTLVFTPAWHWAYRCHASHKTQLESRHGRRTGTMELGTVTLVVHWLHNERPLNTHACGPLHEPLHEPLHGPLQGASTCSHVQSVCLDSQSTVRLERSGAIHEDDVVCSHPIRCRQSPRPSACSRVRRDPSRPGRACRRGTTSGIR